MLKVALSHDIDRIYKTHQHFTRTLRALKERNTKLLLYQFTSLFEKHPYWGFDDIIEVENKYAVRSTMFFLDESAKFKLLCPSEWKIALGRYKIFNKRIVNIMQWLDNNGWEIGVHGSYYSFNNENLLRKEKQNIESIIGHEVIGIRQHYLNLNSTTWKKQYNTGFLYDSSWGLTNGIGFREEKLKPFSPLQNEFYVIPMAIMDSEFVKVENCWKKLDQIIKIIEENNSILVINWHNNSFNEIDFPLFKTYYIELISRLKDKGATFYTLGDYYHINIQSFSNAF